MSKLFDKLFGARGTSGETLVEALVAMLVAGMALIMLAMAIGTAQNIIKAGNDKADEYYGETSTLAKHEAESGDGFTVTVTGPGTGPGSETQNVSVSYAEAEDGSVVAYWASED